MKTYSDSFSVGSLTDFQQNFIKENMIFADIETTGLSASRNQIYCIGCGFRKGSQIRIELLFAENPEEETAVLESFFRLLSGFDTIITFNGTTFDLPFIRKRAGLLSSVWLNSSEIGDISSVDLYRETGRLKNLLELPSCRQKSVEQFLGCCRDDRYTGDELIDVYRKYVKEQDPDLLHLLLLHNFEDVKGMFSLTGILSYRQLGDGRFRVTDTLRETEDHRDYLNIKIVPEFAFPRSIHKRSVDSSLALGQEAALIRFPLKHGILKRFFSDPENYYYLPDEDTAVHKSIGEFVDPSHRKKATKKNCYVKKECDYVEIPVRTPESCLKKEYNEKNTYLEIPSGYDSCRDFLQKYFSQYIK